MPSNLALCALVLVSACVFHADYDNAHYRCTDGKCPSGLTCRADACVAPGPIDASVQDGAVDAAIDARLAALTCADPGVLAAAGATTTGTTAGRSSTISATCSGFVMNGADAVYRLTTAAVGDQFLIGITGVKAYVIAPCSPTPATPACLGNAFATPGNPISITATFAGPHFIVVDHESPATTAAYTLTVTKQ